MTAAGSSSRIRSDTVSCNFRRISPLLRVFIGIMRLPVPGVAARTAAARSCSALFTSQMQVYFESNLSETQLHPSLYIQNIHNSLLHSLRRKIRFYGNISGGKNPASSEIRFLRFHFQRGQESCLLLSCVRSLW